MQPGDTITGKIYGMPVVFKVIPEVGRNIRIVFYDQYTHLSVFVSEHFDTFKALGQCFGIATFIQLDHQPDLVGGISMA